MIQNAIHLEICKSLDIKFMCIIYSPDQSKVKRRAGNFLKSKYEILFSIRYLIFESYWAGEILKASKVAFNN